ncbi:MAG TPA: alpha/beta hydrolase [Rubrobacter sp.]|nr:alpha/beta hydrolase [Rubrobacter sp.]
MAVTTTETGHLAGGLPFVRFGEGAIPLVIFPPINDSLVDATYGTRFWRWYFRRFADDYKVYLISRKRGLPSGYTTRDMAADYGQALGRSIGPAHVMGLSLGGLVAQHFAADHPEHVESLIVGVAARGLGLEGREIVRRWIGLARGERWRELHAEMVVAMYTGVRRPLYELLARLLGGVVVRNPAAREDFVVSAEAALNHDADNRFEAIGTRTLVVGGAQDRLFPKQLQNDTAGRIPGAALRLIEGVGHGAFDERKRDFDTVVKDFIRR